MEKFVNFLKGMGLVAILVVFGVLVYGLVSGPNIFDSISALFKSEPIVVDPYKNSSYNVFDYTKEEIDEQTSDPLCPSLGELESKIYIKDYNDVVVFWYKTTDKNGNDFYPNLLFLKTEDGLLRNGCLNIHATSWVWFGGANSFSWEPCFDQVPNAGNFEPWWHECCYCIFSTGQTCSYIEYRGLFTGGQDEHNLNMTVKYVNERLQPNFLTYNNGSVLIYQDKDGSNKRKDQQFDAFFDYIYRAYKGSSELNGVVDMTKYVACPIPKDEQANYPISDTANFAFYDVDFFINFEAECYDRFLIQNSWQENVDINIEDSDVVQIEDDVEVLPITTFMIWDGLKFEPNNMFDSVSSSIEKTKHLKARAEILAENPVTFNIYQNDEFIKEIVFDTFEDLRDGISLNLRQGEYTYTLSSNAFVFDYTFGNLSVSKNATYVHQYSYLEDSAVVSIGLIPVSTGGDQIIVKNNPVVFTFVNKETKESFSLMFISFIPATKNIILPFGTYDYLITSDFVDFSPKRGEITVSATNHSFIFEYNTSSGSSYILSAVFGETNTLTVRVPTFEIENGALNHRDLTEIWIYNIDSTGKATIKKVSNISNITETEAVILVPYTDLADNFGTTNSTYQIRLFYGQTSYFTTTVSGDTPVKEFYVVYDTVIGI